MELGPPPNRRGVSVLGDSRRLLCRHQRRLSASHLRLHLLQRLACRPKLRLQRSNLTLLFLDRVQHRPDNRIVVHQQVAFAVFRHCFRNDPLHILCDHSDMFVGVANAECIVGLVAVTNRIEFQDLAQAGVEIAVKVLEPAIGVGAPRTASDLIGAAIHAEEIVG